MTVPYIFKGNTKIKSAEVNSNFQHAEDIIAGGWIDADETWAWASSDAPTYTITVPTDATLKYQAGMRIKLTHGGSVKYFIITKVAATVLTVYGGTDYTLSNTAFTLPSYAYGKAPFGFPLDVTKWQVKITDATDRTQAVAAAGTWYNIGTTNEQITIPIGSWIVSATASVYAQNTATTTSIKPQLALSTANNSVSDGELHSISYIYASTTDTKRHAARLLVGKNLTLTSKTLYYLIEQNNVACNLSIRNNADPDMIMKAVCAYL